MDGIHLILKERQRQKHEEGWTKEHDSRHDLGELARASAVYALPYVQRNIILHAFPTLWPWDRKWWKPTPNDRIRELTKAGALIAAEIDRLLEMKKQ